MIVYHKNQEIDREQWDNCIRNSSCIKPYPYSWYLDIMSPGWEALVDDDYDSVFPIPSAGRFGIEYISTPAFLQHLGAYSPDKPAEKAIVEFLYYLPDFYKYVDLNIAQNIDLDSFKVTEKINYEIDLSKPYEKLRERFSAQCMKNIEAAEKKSVLVTGISPDELIDLYILQKTKELKDIKPRDFQKLRNLMNFCIKNKKGRILGVRGARKKVIHGLFIIETKGCKTIQFMVNTPQGREKHLEYFSLNEIIKQSAGTKTTLDLSGAMANELSFCESFGAEKRPYYRVYRNRLLWPVRILK
jgi:uncharacterized protein Usg